MMALRDCYRTALVTGASAGLGRAFAEMLLQEGVAVWGTARTAGRLEVFAQKPQFHPLTVDLREASAVENVWREAGRSAGGFDLVVNNAGYGMFGDFIDEDFAVWAEQMQAMLLAPMQLSHFALTSFRERGRGTLVNVASLAVEFPLPYMSGYNVTKAGLAAFSESLLVETAGTGITVIDFRPGDYRTDFNRAMAQVSSSASQAHRRTGKRQRIWQTLESHLETAPEVERAARDLRRALVRRRSGVVRSGSFFQARLAPAVMALLPQSWQRALRWRYFKVT